MVTDDNHPDICPVRAAYRIFLRAKRLGQLDLQPMGLFVNKYGITRYLTGNKIADSFEFVVRTAHPRMPRDELKRFSSNSGRVWGAGWGTPILYLQDTSVLQQKTRPCLK